MTHQISTSLTSGENNVLMLLISSLVLLAFFRSYNKIEVAFISRRASLSGRLVNLIGLSSYLSYFEYTTPNHSKAIIHTRKTLPPSLLNINLIPLSIKKIIYINTKSIEFHLNLLTSGYILLLNNFNIEKFKLYFEKELLNFFHSTTSSSSSSSSLEINNLYYNLFNINTKNFLHNNSITKNSSSFLSINEISSSNFLIYNYNNKISSSDLQLQFDLTNFSNTTNILHTNDNNNYSLIFIPSLEQSLPNIYDPTESNNNISSKNKKSSDNSEIIKNSHNKPNLLSQIKPNFSILPYPFAKSNSNPSFHLNNQSSPHDLEQGLNMPMNRLPENESAAEIQEQISPEVKKKEEDILCQADNLQKYYSPFTSFNFSLGNIFITSPLSSTPATPTIAAPPSSSTSAPSATSATSSNGNNYKLIPKDIYVSDRVGQFFISSEIFGLDITSKSTINNSAPSLVAPSSPIDITSVAQNDNIPHGGKFIEEDCVICLTDPKNILLLPCRHLCVCSNCLIYVDKCPVCRGQFEEYVTIKDQKKYKIVNN